MKQPFYLADRKLIISMISLSLMALLASMLLSLAMMAYTNRQLTDTYAGIVGTVVQKYPEAESQVVEDLRSPESDAVQLGTQVLEKYGLGDTRTAEFGVATRLLARLLPVGLLLVGLFCT